MIDITTIVLAFVTSLSFGAFCAVFDYCYKDRKKKRGRKKERSE